MTSKNAIFTLHLFLMYDMLVSSNWTNVDAITVNYKEGYIRYSSNAITKNLFSNSTVNLHIDYIIIIIITTKISIIISVAIIIISSVAGLITTGA